MPELTPDQLREHAAEILLNHARDVERLSIREHLDDHGLDDHDDTAVNTIQELISTATITIDWPNSPGQTMDVGADDQLATVTRERDEALQDVQSLTDDISAVRTERDQIDQKLTEAQDERARVGATLADLETDNARLERRCDRLTAQRDDYGQGLQVANRERDQLAAAAAQLAAAVDEHFGPPAGAGPIRKAADHVRQILDSGPAPVPGSSHHAPEAGADVLEKAKPWATPCGRCDYGEPRVGCTCPDGDPRPVMARLVEEVERLRNAQGWDPSSPQWAVIRAAIAWRNGEEVDRIGVDDLGLALIEAVDALPHAGEQVETQEQSSAIVDANLRRMGSRGLAEPLTIRGVRVFRPDERRCADPDRPIRIEIAGVAYADLTDAHARQIAAMLEGVADWPLPATAPKLAQGGIIRTNKLAIVGEPDGCIVPQEADRG